MPSDGASDDHGDDGDDHKMIKCSTWKRRKRKTKPYGDQGKGNFFQAISGYSGKNNGLFFSMIYCHFSLSGNPVISSRE
jgi:hypothetical protein